CPTIASRPRAASEHVDVYVSGLRRERLPALGHAVRARPLVRDARCAFDAAQHRRRDVCAGGDAGGLSQAREFRSGQVRRDHAGRPDVPALLRGLEGDDREYLRQDRGTRSTMTEVLFYHLHQQPLERVLPMLLEKSLERGWRVVVQASSEERIEALDAHLWTFSDDSFLPHGTWREAEVREQPILLTINDDNPNGATVRFLIDGAAVPTDAAAYARIVLMFDGEDADAVAAARERWREAKGSGFEVTYWQADEQGRWQRKA